MSGVSRLRMAKKLKAERERRETPAKPETPRHLKAPKRPRPVRPASYAKPVDVPEGVDPDHFEEMVSYHSMGPEARKEHDERQRHGFQDTLRNISMIHSMLKPNGKRRYN